MAAPINLRSMVFFTAVVVVLLAAGLDYATAEPTKAAVNLRDCDPDGNGYYPSPSPSNCPKVITVMPKGATVYPICKYAGSTVNGDKWWLYVRYGNYKYGFVADYYVDCGNKVCPYSTCPYPMY